MSPIYPVQSNGYPRIDKLEVARLDENGKSLVFEKCD